MTPFLSGARNVALFGTALVGCSSNDPAPACPVGTPTHQVVRYSDLGTFQADTVAVRGVVATASNLLSVLNMNGMGVVGGTSDRLIDSGEWVQVDFGDSVVTDIVVNFGGVGNPDDDLFGEATVEAFDPQGHSLGAKEIVANTGVLSVTAGYEEQAIGSFRFTAEDNFDFF